VVPQDLPLEDRIYKKGKAMNIAKNKTVKELALEEIKKEKAEIAKEKLKELYKKEQSAKKVLANIEREISEYIAELDMDEEDASK
jgi:hypothetical protein